MNHFLSLVKEMEEMEERNRAEGNFCRHLRIRCALAKPAMRLMAISYGMEARRSLGIWSLEEQHLNTSPGIR